MPALRMMPTMLMSHSTLIGSRQTTHDGLLGAPRKEREVFFSLILLSVSASGVLCTALFPLYAHPLTLATFGTSLPI
jgi:hypothetical protein